MKESLYLGDMFVCIHRAETLSDSVIIYLPGLPSHMTSLGEDTDLTPLISSLAPAVTSCGVDVIAPRYPGLDESNGNFGLLRCVYMGLSALGFALSRYRRVSVLGRSFGGLVALAACSRVAGARELDQVVLLAPALGLPVGSGINELARSWSQVLNQPESELAADLEEIQLRWHPMGCLKILDASKLTFICGRNDTVMPSEKAIEVINTLSKKPAFVEVDSDHSFQDRANIVHQILVAMRLA
ncbi:MAG: alpha/beta fold hydrolase [Rhodocyclaceae bacterium]|nr:alpha/beta fold hydrolase [Rhodocyclaceae bacterium]